MTQINLIGDIPSWKTRGPFMSLLIPLSYRPLFLGGKEGGPLAGRGLPFRSAPPGLFLLFRVFSLFPDSQGSSLPPHAPMATEVGQWGRHLAPTCLRGPEISGLYLVRQDGQAETCRRSVPRPLWCPSKGSSVGSESEEFLSSPPVPRHMHQPPPAIRVL